MNWKSLSDTKQIDQLIEDSFSRPVAILKHSTRCSISHIAKNRLERETVPDGMDFYYLDLLSFRSVSNHIAERFAVHHASPQVLLIKNGTCIYDESHGSITMHDLLAEAMIWGTSYTPSS